MLQKHLRCTVPSSAHVLGEGRPRADLLREAKVRKLGEIPTQEDVLRLEVPVHHTAGVHKSHGLKEVTDQDLRIR